MCGRFAITLPKQAMVQLFAAVPGNDLPEGARHNVCPTDPVAVVTAQDGTRRLRAMRWGLLTPWQAAPNAGPPLINARAETVAEKPAFREAIRQRRCLIPADGFYEWTIGAGGKRLPWWVERTDGAPCVFAGLWTSWARDGIEIDSCAIVSTAAGPDMAGIHHREPFQVAPADWPLWLGEAGHGAAVLMKAQPSGTLRRWRVDPAVNSNRAEGPQLRAPLPDGAEPGLPPLAAGAA